MEALKIILNSKAINYIVLAIVIMITINYFSKKLTKTIDYAKRNKNKVSKT